MYYYLYLDEVDYYYKETVKYKEKNNTYFSKKLNNKGKTGYLEITKKGELYLIEFVYNYAKIEALVPQSQINETVLNSSYILSTIKYNKNVIKLSLKDYLLKEKEETYEEFTKKNQDEESFLKYEEK